ncbi:MAG: hypothetical protein JXQ30_13110 [Spirochaetes bacterium]|nr:hypothetical protein [Spirochaetota bacterium]
MEKDTYKKLEEDVNREVENAPLVKNTKLVVKQLIMSLAVLANEQNSDFEKTAQTIIDIGEELHEKCMVHLREALTSLTRMIKTDYLGEAWIDGLDLFE